jgi:hypothetical protein
MPLVPTPLISGSFPASMVGAIERKKMRLVRVGTGGLSADEALSSAYAGCFAINLNADDALCPAPLLERHAVQMEHLACMPSWSKLRKSGPFENPSPEAGH